MPLDDFDAVLFDLDGVLTPTAEVHMRAWATMFTEFLEARGVDEPYQESDYFDYIDGKPRYDGVRSFLAARGIELPEGESDDPATAETVRGLGNRKNEVFSSLLTEEGVEAYPGSVALLDQLAADGTEMAVVSSSKNAPAVLAAAGLQDHFDVVVDGSVATAEALAGKPAPDTFVFAARRLGIAPERAVVVEDALSGVEAGHAGQFGLVVGVDRGTGAERLLQAGADLVVADLAELVRDMIGSSGDDPIRAADPIDRHRFPVDEWRLTESRYSVEDLGVTETLFAVGNGYLGMRGNVEEGRETHTHGTFVNGFHEVWPIRHAEEAFGFARVGQTIVNVPDNKTIKLYVDDEPLLLSVADLERYDRTLDFRDGVLRRNILWRTPAGKRVRVDSTRMVSFTQRHLAIMTMEVTMLDEGAPVVISSQTLNRQDGRDEYHVRAAAMGAGVDPRQAEAFESRVLDPQSHWCADNRIILGYRCANSRMTLAVGVDHEVTTKNAYTDLISADEDTGKMVFRVDAQPGVPVRLTKVVAYHTSRGVPVRELVDRCRRTLDRTAAQGIKRQFSDQRAWLDAYWSRCDVEIGNQPALQQAIRWNLFQLAQATSRAEQSGVPAKGVSGSGYGGHYFWDTEIYVLPFLSYTSPLMGRSALRFRYNMLDAARRRAKDLAQSGALYPWRTINGEEASAYYAAGTAQYHIDADIAYALCKYVSASGDEDFMAREGVDILVETARMWADLGFWREPSPLDGMERSFHIHGVTGPDEYTTVVNDNLFTNVMARYNLAKAAEVVRGLRAQDGPRYAHVMDRLKISDPEVEDWATAAEGMAIPFDSRVGINPQDSHFLEREVWDLKNTPRDKRPLLLHYHPLVIYRFQVLKQADVVLALFLQGDTFSLEDKRADFEYYDPITTGDSTLSGVVQSIIAAEVGYRDLALRYFYSSLFVDLADLHGNTTDGVHVASTGGVWNALAYGFGGMRDYNGVINFDPRLPAQWDRLAFRVTLRGTRVRVEVTEDAIGFTVEEGEQATLAVRNHRFTVSASAPVLVPLAGQGPRIDGIPTLQAGDRRADGSLITASVPQHMVSARQPSL